jgi:hypothetical protein
LKAKAEWSTGKETQPLATTIWRSFSAWAASSFRVCIATFLGSSSESCFAFLAMGSKV